VKGLNILVDKYNNNVQLFNDVFYKNCKYNPLLSGIGHFGGSVISFLANDFFSYRLNKNCEFEIDVQEIQVKPDSEILQELGIKLDNECFKENSTEEIIDVLSEGVLVFLPVNRYYLKSDWHYQKINSVHYFLITGYNALEEKFYIIDVTSDFALYSEITYLDLLEAYKGWLHWKGESAEMKMSRMYRYNIIRNEHIKKNDYFLNFKSNFNLIRDALLKGIDYLLDASMHLQKVGLNENFFEKDELSLAKPFYYISIAKKIEMYRTHKLLGGSKELFETLESIRNNWDITRSLFLKMRLKKSISDKSIGTIINKIEENYYMELECIRLTDSILLAGGV